MYKSDGVTVLVELLGQWIIIDSSPSDTLKSIKNCELTYNDGWMYFIPEG